MFKELIVKEDPKSPISEIFRNILWKCFRKNKKSIFYIISRRITQI